MKDGLPEPGDMFECVDGEWILLNEVGSFVYMTSTEAAVRQLTEDGHIERIVRSQNGDSEEGS